MSNRRKSQAERAARKLKPWACPKCGSEKHTAREYDDTWLFICAICEFPERKVK